MIKGGKTKKHNFTFDAWSCEHDRDISRIAAYSLLSGQRKVIFDVRSSAGFPARELAEFVVAVVNERPRMETVIREMSSALEMCLEKPGALGWSAEHDSEKALRLAGEIPRRCG